MAVRLRRLFLHPYLFWVSASRNRCSVLLSDIAYNYCNKCGQTAGSVCGDTVQKGCDFNAGTLLYCSFLAFFFSHWIVIILLQVKCNYFLKLLYSTTVCGYLDIMLHENLSQASQSPSSWTDSAEAVGRESNSNERSTLQKDSVQWTLFVCYRPYGILTVKSLHIKSGFLNSSLNPFLYCWRMREVRQAVKTLTRKCCCFAN